MLAGTRSCTAAWAAPCANPAADVLVSFLVSTAVAGPACTVSCGPKPLPVCSWNARPLGLPVGVSQELAPAATGACEQWFS